MRLAVMVSGKLGFKTLKTLKDGHEVIGIFTDKGSQAIIDYAEQNQLDFFIGNPRNGKASSFIANKEIDVLLSINYLFLIEEDLIQWPKTAAINLHGSLLPKYRGRTPHVWAIINNEKFTGVTAHLMTKGCDEGAIILQKEIMIDPEDTGASVLSKYEKVYPDLVNEVLNQIAKGEMKPKKQDESLATYFGKRTPNDGEINWSWQKERIKNWVRAQAYPYPGAFTWLDDQKVIIDSVEEDDFGFQQTMKNGMILTDNPLRVKTPNGVLRIIKLREEIQASLEGKKFRSNENS
ncbi:methionyl-tRNA formyltransferase [uncultured Roseivirga sp.]|uniref:methionyl-tRNA formyltransferase n=1 Tax=uncultured Roseivirga sp. TaxID=543088 RepID=UPI000D7B27EF|nr:methionyl-tRNA formyltransferase [uncultured Roseivirga sp.]PWL30923.1 MAG: formyl transferase [Roseivirga sp. XM-24bin3]